MRHLLVLLHALLILLFGLMFDGCRVDPEKEHARQSDSLYTKLEKDLTVPNNELSADSMIRYLKARGNACFHTCPDSAFYYFSAACHLADSLGLLEQYPDILYELAICHEWAYDYQTAIQWLDSASNYFSRQGDAKALSNALNAMASIKHAMNDFEGAQQFYDSAFLLAKSHDLKKQKGVALANLSKFEADPAKRIQLQKEAIDIIRNIKGCEEELALMMINVGSDLPNADSAIPYYRKAIDIGNKQEANLILIGAWNNLAYSYLEKGNIQKAEKLLRDQAIPLAQSDNNFDWLATLYDSYADVMVERGAFADAFALERKAMEAKQLYDIQRGASQMRLLSAILDLKNKELLIRETQTKLVQEEDRSQRWLLLFMVAVLILFVVGVLMMIMLQRQKILRQKQRLDAAAKLIAMEEQERERIGKELHDITGQLMIEISGEIETITIHDTTQKSRLIQNIRNIGDGIRHLSHLMVGSRMNRFDFEEVIRELIDGYQKSTGLNILLDFPAHMPSVPSEISMQLYRIVQEWLTNAAKYAPKSTVILSCGIRGKNMILTCSDDGQGFDVDSRKAGIGISTIFERINYLGGKGSLEAHPDTGTFWEISMPIDSEKNRSWNP